MTQKARRLTAADVRSILILLETPRDRALFALGLYAGLAVSEIIQLTQDAVFVDSDRVREIVTVTRRRGSTPRSCDIPIHQKLREILREHRKTLPPGHWLLPSRWEPNQHISRQQAHKVLTKAFRELKRDDARTHSMRRTFLMTLLASDVPSAAVQAMSGLVSLDNLGHYLETHPSDKKRAILQLPY